MSSQLRQIANGFDVKVGSFKSYDVNGYRFHTIGYELSRANRTSTNSGVFVECGGDDFYGRVEEIYELQYRGPKPPKVAVFKCRWIDPKHVTRMTHLA